MNAAPIDLRLCPACRTGIPAESRVCPECGAPQPAEEPTHCAGPPPNPFEAFGGMPQGANVGKMAMAGLARGFLGRNRGCLLTVLLVVFGPPVVFGAVNYGVLGGLGGALLVVSGLGLLLTTWLVWLLRAK